MHTSMKAGMAKTGESNRKKACHVGKELPDAAKSLEWNSDRKLAVVSEGAGTYGARDTVTSEVINKAHNSQQQRSALRHKNYKTGGNTMMWKAGIGLQGALDMGKSMWITTCYDEVVLQPTKGQKHKVKGASSAT